MRVLAPFPERGKGPGRDGVSREGSLSGCGYMGRRVFQLCAWTSSLTPLPPPNNPSLCDPQRTSTSPLLASGSSSMKMEIALQHSSIFPPDPKCCLSASSG